MLAVAQDERIVPAADGPEALGQALRMHHRAVDLAVGDDQRQVQEVFSKGNGRGQTSQPRPQCPVRLRRILRFEVGPGSDIGIAGIRKTGGEPVRIVGADLKDTRCTHRSAGEVNAARIDRKIRLHRVDSGQHIVFGEPFVVGAAAAVHADDVGTVGAVAFQLKGPVPVVPAVAVHGNNQR